MMDETVKKQRIATIILAGGLLLAALLAFLWSVYMKKNAGRVSPEDLVVSVEAEGKQLYAVPLSDEKELPVMTKEGENVVKISGGKAFVESADCKNQICVHSNAISAPGETIVCLPHRVVVSITVRNSQKN